MPDAPFTGSNMILIGWVNTVSGNPGTWEEMHVSTVSPAN